MFTGPLPVAAFRRRPGPSPLHSSLADSHALQRMGMAAAGSEFLRIMLDQAVAAAKQGDMGRAQHACAAAGVLAAIMVANALPITLPDTAPRP